MIETIGVLERAFKLLEIVCKEKEFTAKTIAEKLNCSERTARRYIEKIRFIFEGQIEKKKGYKYVWKGLPAIDRKLLDSPSLRIFYAFMELGKKVGDDKAFLQELERVFSTNESINKIIIGSVIDFEKIKDIKLKIEDAIKRSKLIKFKYKKSSKYYTVEPYKVILSSGFWYLFSIDTKNRIPKTFALDLIENVEIEEDSAFEKYKNLKKIKKLLEEAENIIQITEVNNPEEVIIEVSKDIAIYFERREILRHQEILSRTENGNIRIKFIVRNEHDFKIQTFQWLPYVKIISPEKYKKYLEHELKEALNFLKKKE